jgi:precorrin-6B methylase 2
MNFKQIVKKLLPKSWRSQYFLDELLTWPVVVRSGIFQGMDYVVEALGFSLLPKLIGSYEKELSSIFEALRNRKVKLIFDIGAAEGYYAVGLARMLPECQVVAFEATKQGRNLLAEMARKNHVENQVDIHGECTIEQFEELLALKKPDFVLMDVEGAEKDLINPRTARLLSQTELLVELHPAVVRHIENQVRSATSGTHQPILFECKERSYQDFWKNLNFFQKLLCGKTLSAFMGEGRTESHWLQLVPKPKYNNER